MPHLLTQYKTLIDDGYSKPYDEALAWEEQQSIESARQMRGAMVSARRDSMMAQGRQEKDKT